MLSQDPYRDQPTVDWESWHHIGFKRLNSKVARGKSSSNALRSAKGVIARDARLLLPPDP